MNLKTLLPFDHFKLVTKLSVNEVQAKMESITQPKLPRATFSLPKTGKPYEGIVANNTFEITRVINYRNSFLPTIKGKISSYIGQTEIAIRMQPLPLVLVFMSFWLGAVGLACLGIIVAVLVHSKEVSNNSSSFAAIIPFVMFVFGYSLLILAYRTESQKSKAFLKQLLEAQEDFFPDGAATAVAP